MLRTEHGQRAECAVDVQPQSSAATQRSASAARSSIGSDVDGAGGSDHHERALAARAICRDGASQLVDIDAVSGVRRDVAHGIRAQAR